jgi:hypothetical protein
MRRLAYIINGIMAMAIHPERVAMGGLIPMASFGQ